jgi:signal transduction histidine kinase
VQSIANTRDRRDPYEAWLVGQLLLFGLLAAALALYVAYPSIRGTHSLPQIRLFLNTAVMLVAAFVAVLTGVRFAVDGRRLDLLLCSGFVVSAISTFAFSIAPVLDGRPLAHAEAWAAIGGRLLEAFLLAVAPLACGRFASRHRAGIETIVGILLLVVLVWVASHVFASSLPPITALVETRQPLLLTGALALLALLRLVAAVGFGLRYRSRREDLDRWLALAATLALFAELYYVFTPVFSTNFVSQGDVLLLISYGMLLVGVWRAILSAEFGHAVADERARIAREIHDGLAQYLFAISAHASMLEQGAPPETTIPKLKDAAVAAQQEARFAVLALSSASGNAPFDAALQRYVDFLTADGTFAVDLEIDPAVRLAPDEQIEIFRIVQEGLANVRTQARAGTAEGTIGQSGGRRYVTVRDDGEGFDGEARGAGQGLRNIRARAASIDGGFNLRSTPGRGTALEVTLRSAT